MLSHVVGLHTNLTCKVGSTYRGLARRPRNFKWIIHLVICNVGVTWQPCAWWSAAEGPPWTGLWVRGRWGPTSRGTARREWPNCCTTSAHAWAFHEMFRLEFLFFSQLFSATPVSCQFIFIVREKTITKKTARGVNTPEVLGPFPTP
jgi:hypothetical protein